MCVCVCRERCQIKGGGHHKVRCCVATTSALMCLDTDSSSLLPSCDVLMVVESAVT